MESTIDIFPSVAKLIGAQVSTERKIDGKDIWPLMSAAPGVTSPHDVLYCFYDRQLRAVRDSQFKLVFPHQYRSLDGKPAGRDGVPANYKQLKTKQALYDLKNDVGEATDVSADHPDVVARLEHAGEEARAALGDELTNRTGSEVRPPGRITEK